MAMNDPQDVGTPAASGTAATNPHKTIYIVIAILGAALLVGVGLIVGLLAANGNQPAATPEPAPSETEAPSPAALADILVFSAEQSVAECADADAGTTATVRLSWSVTGAERIALARGETPEDAIEASSSAERPAEQAGYEGMPFDCAAASQVYSLTAANADDERTSAYVTVQRTVREAPPIASPTTPPPSNPPAVQPVITEFTLLSNSPNVICEDPALTRADLLVRWNSNVSNNRTEIRAHAPDGTVLRDGLPGRGSVEVGWPCDRDSEVFLYVVVYGSANASANAVLQMSPPRPLVITSFTIELGGSGSGTLAQRCQQADTVPIMLRWDTSGAHTLWYTRQNTPGNDLPAQSIQQKTGQWAMSFRCEWSFAQWTLTIDNGVNRKSQTIMLSRT